MGPKQVLKALASYMKKLPKCLWVSTPDTMPSAAKQSRIASWGVPYDWLTEEEKIRAWFTDGSVHYSGSTQKRTAAAL